MRAELTDEFVDAVDPRATRQDYTDIGNPGFGVRVYPTGVKTWFYRYRIKDSVRLMRLGRTTWLSHYAALKKYQRMRNLRLQGRDPQGTHPVSQEALHVLLEIWYMFSVDRGLPDTINATPSLEEFAAHFKVSVAAIKKLSAHGYLTLLEREGRTVVVPLPYAIRYALEEGDTKLI